MVTKKERIIGVATAIIIWVILLGLLIYIAYLGFKLKNKNTDDTVSISTQNTEEIATSTKGNMVDIKGYVYSTDGNITTVYLDNGMTITVNFAPYYPDGTHVVVSIDENNVVRGISELIK